MFGGKSGREILCVVDTDTFRANRGGKIRSADENKTDWIAFAGDKGRRHGEIDHCFQWTGCRNAVPNSRL